MFLGSGKTNGLGLHVKQGGTFVGGSGNHTMGSLGVDNNAAAKYTNTSATNTLNGHSNDSTRVIIGGALSTCTAAGTITITYAGGAYNFQNGNAAMINNLTLNSNVTANLSAATSITGNLTISQGTLTTTASDYALTVAGYCDVTGAGTLTLNGSTVSVAALRCQSGAAVTQDSDGTLALATGSNFGGTEGSSYSLRNVDGTSDINLGGTTTVTGGAYFEPRTATVYASVLNNIVWDSNQYWVGEIRIGGTLVVNATEHMQPYGGSKNVTVVGAVTLNGQLSAHPNAHTDLNLMTFGSLTINSGGAYAATSGTTTLLGNFDNNGTDPTTSFVHNDGTFKMGAVGNAQLRGGSSSTGTIFFNLLHDSGGYVDAYEYYKVINKLTVDSSRTWYINGSSHVKLGDTTRNINGELEINGVLHLSSSNTGTGTSNSISGDNTNPGGAALVDINNGASSFANGAAKATEFKNLNFDGTFTTPGNSLIVKCMGDMEFDAVTVSSGDKLDLNGNRMQLSGFFNAGTLQDNASSGGQIWTAGGFNFTGGNSWTGMSTLSTTDYIVTASDSHYINATPFKNVVVNTTGSPSFQNYAPDAGTSNLILAGGTMTKFGNDGSATGTMSVNNITIATGAIMDNASLAPVLSCAGDFTTSGGLIGKSAFEVTGTTYASGSSILDYSSASVTAITMSGWVKLDDVANGANNQFILRQNDNFIGLNRAGAIYVGVELQNSASGYDYPAVITADGTIGDDKWHHVAMTWASGSTLKAYMDGKLIGENTTISADYVRLRQRGAGQSTGVGGLGTPSLAGIIAQTCRWHTEKTPEQIRTEMFQDFSSLSSNTDCIYWYQFDTGTGTTVFDSTSADCDLTSQISNGTATASWAGAGTFVQGTSTVDLTGTGTLTYQGEIDFNILKTAAATKTTTVQRLSSGDININTNLYKGAGTLTTGSSIGWRLSRKTGVGDVNNSGLVVSGASYPVDLSSSYIAYYHDATIAKEVKWQFFINGSDTTFAANQEATGYWHNAAFQTDVGDYNLKCTYMRYSDAEAGKFTMGSGDLWLTNNGAGLQATYPSNTFTVGPGATVSGSTAGTNFKSQNNFSVVGKIENLDVTNQELNVMGQVINCTGDIIQQHQTQDSAQQLDYDTADDRDVMLGRDLDKNTELVG